MRSEVFILPAMFAICLGGGARAQTPPQAPPGSTQTPTQTPTPVPPGSTQTPADPAKDPNAPKDSNAPKDPNAPPAAAAPANPDATQLSDANGQPAGGDYTGPSVLSRGFNFARPAIPTQEKFRPFAGLNLNYDSGLTGPFLGLNGQVASTSSLGIDGSFGISGRKFLRKQVFELDYRGHLYYYASNTKYNGQEHSLSAGYTRYLSSRLLVSLHENAGLYSDTYAVLNATSNSDLSTGNVSLVVSPNTESFDSRTYFSTSEADVVYQKSARLSFNIGASGFFVKRNSASLVNTKGYQARADAAYRFTKQTTIGAYYAYSSYDFSPVFGSSDVHTVGADYSVAFTKSLSLKLRVGASRVEVQGLRTVTLDPLIAAILGQFTGIERYYQVNYTPDFSGSLDKTTSRASYGASFAIGVSPGNGLYLTSRHESESVTYNYTGIRRYALGVSGGRDKLLSIGDIAGNYSSYFGRVSATRSLPYHMQSTFSTEYRRLGFSSSGYGRNEFRISMGLTFAGGEGPLKFW
jgi:hypothetical protein